MPRAAQQQVHWPAIEILAERKRDYLINWQGDDPSTGKAWMPTWEPKSYANAALVAQWHARSVVSKDGIRRAPSKLHIVTHIDDTPSPPPSLPPSHPTPALTPSELLSANSGGTSHASPTESYSFDDVFEAAAAELDAHFGMPPSSVRPDRSEELYYLNIDSFPTITNLDYGPDIDRELEPELLLLEDDDEADVTYGGSRSVKWVPRRKRKSTTPLRDTRSRKREKKSEPPFEEEEVIAVVEDQVAAVEAEEDEIEKLRRVARVGSSCREALDAFGRQAVKHVERIFKSTGPSAVDTIKVKQAIRLACVEIKNHDDDFFTRGQATTIDPVALTVGRSIVHITDIAQDSRPRRWEGTLAAALADLFGCDINWCTIAWTTDAVIECCFAGLPLATCLASAVFAVLHHQLSIAISRDVTLFDAFLKHHEACHFADEVAGFVGEELEEQRRHISALAAPPTVVSSPSEDGTPLSVGTVSYERTTMASEQVSIDGPF